MDCDLVFRAVGLIVRLLLGNLGNFFEQGEAAFGELGLAVAAMPKESPKTIVSLSKGDLIG